MVMVAWRRQDAIEVILSRYPLLISLVYEKRSINSS